MSCGLNPFCWFMGDPAPAGPRAAYDAAARDLRAARARGDQQAVRAALARMQAANKAMRAASRKALGKVARVDKAVASVKQGVASVAHAGRNGLVMLGLAALALWWLKR